MDQIIEVNNRAQLREFIELPHKLFKNDPIYVPELNMAVKDMFNKKKHPFHKHSKVKCFIYIRNNEAVGRIAVICNNNHNNFNHCKEAFFGFYNSLNDISIARGLLNKATEWAKSEGLEKLIGPTNFSTNESCGLLIEGFSQPPSVMMPYNPMFYGDLLSSCGFSKKVDLYAYLVESESISDKSIQLSDLFEKRLEQKGIKIRTIRNNKFFEEIKEIRKIYNEAWNRNLGFVPMTDDEFLYMAKELKMVYDPELCLIAEHNGKMIGFALALPDINQVLIKIANGKLLPTGLFKLLYYKRKIDALRVLTLGVIEGYRKQGIETCFYARIIQTGRRKGYKRAEASWILENNVLMNQALLKLNSKLYKKYRIYEKSI